MPKYPTVNFIGNKEKVVDWIIEELPIKKGVVLDLFAGGCSVSYALKQNGFKVISNDILYSNYVLSKAIIENNKVILHENDLDIKIPANEIKKQYKKIESLSNRLYHQYEVEELAKLILISNRLKGYKKYIYLALLRRAMIRKLPYSRMNVIWREILRFRDEELSYKLYKRRRAYHNKTFEFHIKDNMDEYNDAVFGGKQCKAYNEDAIELSKKITRVDAIYIDPPYPGTMNNYDIFYGDYDKAVKSLKKHTDFTSQESFIDNIKKIVELYKKKTKFFIFSLNTNTKPSIEELKDALKEYGSCTIKKKEHCYKVTSKQMKHKNSELLLILKIR